MALGFPCSIRAARNSFRSLDERAEEEIRAVRLTVNINLGYRVMRAEACQTQNQRALVPCRGRIANGRGLLPGE